MSADTVATPTPLEVADLVTVALSRQIRPGELVAVGVGTPLALAAALLARALDPSVHVLVNGAVDPDADVEVCSRGADAFTGRTAGYVSMLDTLDMVERQRATLEFLRPAQIDGQAQLNTSCIGPAHAPKVRFPGGLGTADTPTLLPHALAYLPDHQRRSLPARVDRVTGSGRPWHAGAFRGEGCPRLVTEIAVIGFGPDGAVLERRRHDVEIEEIRARTGFALDTSAGVELMRAPDTREAALLTTIDPAGRRISEVPV